jgi:hypothetical protein
MKNSDFEESDGLINGLIESALESYAAGEPRAGLENRILNRIRAENTAGRLVFRWWVWAFPVLAWMFFGLVRWNEHPAKPAIREAAVAGQERPRSTAEAKPRIHAALRVAPAQAPKQAVFPAVRPLTAEERALMAFVRMAPKDAATIVDRRERGDMPIEIEGISITPLQSESEQEGANDAEQD